MDQADIELITRLSARAGVLMEDAATLAITTPAPEATLSVLSRLTEAVGKMWIILAAAKVIADDAAITD